jgi:hypothetical protein
MTGGEALPSAILQRKAVVHVRQSTQAQVEMNLESRRRQYGLVDVARRRGFRTVVHAVIIAVDGDSAWLTN